MSQVTLNADQLFRHDYFDMRRYPTPRTAGAGYCTWDCISAYIASAASAGLIRSKSTSSWYR